MRVLGEIGAFARGVVARDGAMAEGIAHPVAETIAQVGDDFMRATAI